MNPLDIAKEINRVLKENPAANLGDNKALTETLKEINQADASFAAKGGVFFETGSNAFETAQRFTEIHVEQYRNTGRPSLPALAVHHAQKLELDTSSPEYKALILIAVRAEMKAATTPDYHSQFHYADVAAMTANLLEKNNSMVKAGDNAGVPLSKKDQALTLLTAMGHDIDHDGNSNPPTDPLFNEKKSFAVLQPLLKEAGITDKDIAKVHTMLMTTSPNGPHAILKGAAAALRDGNAPDFSKIDPEAKFPELQNLGKNSALTQMAAMVSDADLYASSGAGMQSSTLMSALLTAEGKKAGGNMDFTSDSARKFFLDKIVGVEGYASNAGRAVANDSLNALRAETEKRLEASKFAAPIVANVAPAKPAIEAPKQVAPAKPAAKQISPK